jgi:hypothetical protein
MRTFQPSGEFLQKSFAGITKNLFVRPFRYLAFFAIIICGLHISSSAQTGEALEFDGTNDIVTLPNLLPSGSYTKEAWINADLFGASSNNIVSGNSSAFWAPGGNLSAGHAGGGFTDVQDPAAMSTGTWYHVAVTYNSGTNTLTLYKDGVLVGTPGAAAGAYSETGLYIGDFSAPGSSPWFGLIDEVRIWNVVRTGAEIAANRNCILTGDEPGLVAYYDFDQGVAGGANAGVTTLLDRSDKCAPNNGTLTGFALSGGASNWVAPGAGIAGSCGGTFANANITGNSVCISDGDATPVTGDHTDFGTGNPVTRTFTIQNTGSATLNVTGVVISGVNAAEFSVTANPAATVAAAGSTTFNITFTAASNGVKNATITVNSDDGDEAAYDFAVSASFFTLPVELRSFTLRKEGNQSQLNWSTVTESNNSGFEIQRSRDGINWTTIAFVSGAGNSTIERSYTYRDASPQKGRNYYRLKQVDLDNKSKFSEVRSVTFASDYTIVYPVPTADNVVIELRDSKLIGSRATLSDQHGKLVQQITITKMQQQVSLASLPAGIYLLRMEDGSVNKLVKQ